MAARIHQNRMSRWLQRLFVLLSITLSRARQATFACFILSFSLSAVADYSVSLIPSQQFPALAEAETAMRAFNPQASHLVLDRQDNNAQVNYYNVPSVAATPATANIYGAPYYAHAGGYWVEQPFNSMAAAFADWWAHYQVRWAYAFPGCNVRVTIYPNGPTTNYFEDFVLSGTCGGGNYMSGTLITPAGSASCPTDYTLSGNQCVIGLTAIITQTLTCPIPDLPPITDPAVQAFEDNPNTSDTAHLTNEMQTALQRLVAAASAVGGAPTVGSAYRPPAYNQHLIDVWDKWVNKLKPNKDAACANLKAKIHGHFQRHGLLESQSPVANSRHTRGEAVDVSIDLPSANIDTLARGSGLRRPLPVDDPVHFQFP